MINKILEMYNENSWLPKWEVSSSETFKMVGDPAAVVLNNTFLHNPREKDKLKEIQVTDFQIALLAVIKKGKLDLFV